MSWLKVSCIKHTNLLLQTLVDGLNESRKKPVTWPALLLAGIKCRHWKINAKYIQIVRLQHLWTRTNYKPHRRAEYSVLESHTPSGCNLTVLNTDTANSLCKINTHHVPLTPQDQQSATSPYPVSLHTRPLYLLTRELTQCCQVRGVKAFWHVIKGDSK